MPASPAGGRVEGGTYVQDFCIPQGVDWPGYAFPIFDEEDQVYDLTGCSARGQIRRVPDHATALFTWSTNPGVGEGLLTLADGWLTVRVLGDESSQWDWKTGCYDIELLNPNAPIGKRKHRLAKGVVTLDLEVTR